MKTHDRFQNHDINNSKLHVIHSKVYCLFVFAFSSPKRNKKKTNTKSGNRKLLYFQFGTQCVINFPNMQVHKPYGYVLRTLCQNEINNKLATAAANQQ